MVTLRQEGVSEEIVEETVYFARHNGCGILGGGWSGRQRQFRSDAKSDLEYHLENCIYRGEEEDEE